MKQQQQQQKEYLLQVHIQLAMHKSWNLQYNQIIQIFFSRLVSNLDF